MNNATTFVGICELGAGGSPKAISGAGIPKLANLILNNQRYIQSIH
jgi:hypothetical protein